MITVKMNHLRITDDRNQAEVMILTGDNDQQGSRIRGSLASQDPCDRGDEFVLSEEDIDDLQRALLNFLNTGYFDLEG